MYLFIWLLYSSPSSEMCDKYAEREKLGRRENLCVHICERPAVLICYA